MKIRLVCVLVVILVIQESFQIELDEVKAEILKPRSRRNRKKLAKTKPYGVILMDDTPKEFTEQGYMRRKEAEYELEMLTRHRSRYEMRLQDEEEYCLEYHRQCIAASKRGIPDRDVVLPRGCATFRKKYDIPISHLHHRRRGKRFVQGTGGVADTLRWDKCIVPYNMSNIVTENDIWQRIRAQRKYEYWTSFRFMPWNSSIPSIYDLTHENHLIHVKTPPGCWSFVGNIRSMKGQKISTCGGVTAQHEIGHALGAHHAQANPTRDHYIKVNMDFIADNWKNQFTKKSQHKTDQWYHYDFGSILHYGIYSSGNQGLQTLTPYDLIHMYELINTDLYSFYLHRALDAVHGCAAKNCVNDTDRFCENEGFLSELGYENKCGCRCCEGLDPETNCTTTYRGSQDGANADWPGGTYSIPKALDAPCPPGFSSGSVTQYLPWLLSSGASNPFHYDVEEGTNYLKHKFCTKTSSNGKEFSRGQYCILKYGNCPSGFTDGFVQFEDEQQPVTNGTVPDGNYTSHLRLDFCCRQDGNYDDEMVLPYGESFVLFQQSSSGCQHVKDMFVISETITIQNKKTVKAYDTSGWTPYILKRNSQSKYTIFFCYYKKLNYDCGDVIKLNATNSTVSIQSPGYPISYPNYMRCHWLIKSPPGTQMLIQFPDFEIEDTVSGTCADFVDVRYYGCGSSGKYMCGKRSDYGLRSLHNHITIIFGTDHSTSMKGFNVTVSIVNYGELRYIPFDYGRSYRGKVNFTRTFKPCLHWADVTHCEHHPFNRFDLTKNLEENYCRSPGPGTEPWCYYEASQCMVDTCDVSLIEPCHDISTQCDDIPCSDEEASRVCNKKCSCNTNNDDLRGESVDSVTCGPPPNLNPEAKVTAYRNSYHVGETVTYECKTGPETTSTMCMSDGNWSPLNYVCHSCPRNWVPYNDACYAIFDTYMKKKASKLFCKVLGAEVVSIRSQAEQDFLVNMRDGNTQAWIGILYMGNNHWIWEDDGASVTYTNYASGRLQGCAYMSKNGNWNGVPCDSNTFKGVFCKIRLSERKTCVDQRNDCKKLLLKRPTACVDFEEFSEFTCPYTCGFCVPDKETVATCNRPNDTGNFTLEVGDTDSITAGNVFGYRCLDDYYLAEGDLFRVCHTDGTISGSKPVCKLISDMEVIVNYFPMIRRRWVGTARRAYFALNEQHLIPRDGVLTEWIYFSLFPGDVTFQVWESTNTSNTFKLIGRTIITATGDGRKQRTILTGSDRINVKKGQYIGIHYPYFRAGITYDTCSTVYTGPYDNQLTAVTTSSFRGGFAVNTDYLFKVPFKHHCRVWSFTAKIV